MAHRFHPVTLGEVLALEGHAVLHGNAAAQRLDTIDVALGNGLGVVEEPVQAIKGDLAVHFLEDVQHPADGLIVGGVQTERPAVLHQMTHHALEFVFHARRQIRARLEEIFEVSCREDQHLACAVMAEEVGALARLEHIGPLLEIFQLVAGTLGKQVVGDTDRHLLFLMQFGDHFVVFRVVLETAARVDGAG